MGLLQQQKPTPKPTKKKATTTTTTGRTTSKTTTKKKETKLEMSKRVERQMEEPAARTRTTQTKVPFVRKVRGTAATTPITTSTPNKMKQQRGGADKETRLEMKARVKREYAAKAASKKK